MPDLEHTFQGHDLGFLKIVARAWGIDLNAPDAATALPAIVQKIIEHSDFTEVIEALPQDARNVLQVLIENDGRLPWAAFNRKYGDVRRMGSARRDRERPDIKPSNAVEVLWYRGLIGRAFLSQSSETEPQEYAYIPDDVLPLLPILHGDMPLPIGRPATPNEMAFPIPVTDQVLDHACTLLAALRLKLDEAEIQRLDLGGIPAAILKQILSAARLLDYDGIPHPDTTRAFLEAPRGRALAQLVQAWMSDAYFNELRMLPGLKFEGEWINDPLRARTVILDLVSQIPENRWWGLTAFISALQDQQPDFQRPAGDYDSWFIRQESTGNFLRGFSAWDDVEGALVRFLITGPMHWLGLVDLAANEPSAPPNALHLSRWATALWHGEAPEINTKEDGLIKASPDGRMIVSALVPRTIRYQIARFCTWEGERERNGHTEYLYRVVPSSLERARNQSLRPSQLLGLLRRQHEGPLPPALAQALERWENTGTQAIIEQVVLLRVTSPDILAALRKTRPARCLGDTLNETTVLVRQGMEEQVQAALIEIGYLSEAILDSSGNV